MHPEKPLVNRDCFNDKGGGSEYDEESFGRRSMVSNGILPGVKRMV